MLAICFPSSEVTVKVGALLALVRAMKRSCRRCQEGRHQHQPPCLGKVHCCWMSACLLLYTMMYSDHVPGCMCCWKLYNQSCACHVYDASACTPDCLPFDHPRSCHFSAKATHSLSAARFLLHQLRCAQS